jgi:starvation-inducible DNA-binding protein
MEKITMAKKAGAAPNTTRNDLDAATRSSMVDLLNQQLADTSDLFSQVKQAHWNTKGPHFIALHELFDDLAGGLIVCIDDIAERAVQLGGNATGTVRMAAAASRLPDFSANAISGIDAVVALADRFATLAASTRAGIDAASEAGDADTADLLTEVSRGLDKSLWFLEAHLQA